MIRNYSTRNFFDADLNNEKDIFFNTMNSFHLQKKEEEDFNTETENNIYEINSYYLNEKENFNKQFKKKQEQLMEDYSYSIDWLDFNREAKIKRMNEIYNNASKQFLQRIENKRWNTIQNYRCSRRIQYNNLIGKHKNFWKNKNLKLLLPEESNYY